MSDNASTTDVTALGQPDDDFDVEAHGMREMAIGLSAATVVAGSAGAAAACMDFGGEPEPQRLPLAAPSAPSVNDHRLAQPADLVDRAVDRAGVSVVDVQRAAGGSATLLVGVGKPGSHQSSYAMGQVDRTTDEALRTARELRDSTLKTATDVAASTAATAQATAHDTADRAAEVAREAWKTLNPRASVSRHGSGATVQVSAAGKSVTIDAS